jgi:hypothetical protein
VTVDGENLLSHGGTALLTELADRSGLTKAMSLSMAECGISWHTHDRGVVLTHSAVAMADGAGCLADLAALREHDELFGPVASIVTAWRAVKAAAASGLRAIPPAVAAARAKVWAASPPGVGCETTNEPLAAMLRPRNAGSNDADHHLELLDQAIDTDGSIRDGAWVVELTDLVDPSAWPEGTRLIMRRERPHPEVPRTDGSAEVVDQTTPNSILAAGSMTPRCRCEPPWCTVVMAQ